MRPLADILYGAAASPSRVTYPLVTGRKRVADGLRNNIREARRFYVDEEVTRSATKLGVTHPDVLLSMLRRARLPFRKVWVEWDNHAQIDEALELGCGGKRFEDAPQRVGAFIERLDENQPIYRLTTMGEVTDPDYEHKGHVAICAISVVYNLNEKIEGKLLDQQAAVAKTADLPVQYVRQSLIGGAYLNRGGTVLVKDGAYFDTEEATQIALRSDAITEDQEEVAHRRKLCDEMSLHAVNVFSESFALVMKEVEANPTLFNTEALTRTVRNSVVEDSGTWRFIISLFALINAQDYVDSERTYKQGKSRMVGGKVVPYLDHWLVKLKLPRKVVEPRILKEFADAIPRRRHEVIGHFKKSRRRYPEDPNCNHAWVNLTATKESCLLCGHRRWWQKESMRGDATVGIILKDRLVTRT